MPGTILLVERERLTRERYDAALTEKGFSTITAADGVEAIRAIGQTTFDAIVLDLQLPRLGGLDVLAFIEQHTPALLRRVLLLTGVDVAQIRELYPICTTLGKPVLPSRLRS